MSTDDVPVSIRLLMALHDPTKRIARATQHSDRCWTIQAVSPDHHAEMTRWNLADDGHWTMIPVRQGWLDISA